MSSIHLTENQWAFIQPLLPPPARTGRPRADDRRTIDGILYTPITGCRWQDLRLEQDGGNHISGLVRFYDYVMGDKAMCFSVTGTALLGASFHLEYQPIDVKPDTPFARFDGSGATEGYTLEGAYGLGREVIAHLNGTIQQSTPEELDFSCPTPYNVTPTP